MFRAAVASDDELWSAFKAGGTDAEVRLLRDQLILLYSPLVKFVAGRVASGLPPSVDSADLVSYGVFGLIDAIDKFEPERGHRFESYAMSRIRGAMVDGLRSLDWVPRTLRARAREIERAIQRFEAEVHRAPSESELAAAMQMTVRQLQSNLSRIAQAGVTTLDGSLSDGIEPRSTLGADPIAEPGEGLLAEESRQALRANVAALPPRERTVLLLYYFENLNMAEIGQIVGVSESRVCQIHAKAVLHLRARLSTPDDDSGLIAVRPRSTAFGRPPDPV